MNPGIAPLCVAYAISEAQKKPVDPQRAAFEAWAATIDMDVTPLATPVWGNLYSDCNTDYAWQAWQASRKQAIDPETIRLAEVALSESMGMPCVQDWQDAALRVCWAIRRLSTPEGGL